MSMGDVFIEEVKRAVKEKGVFSKQLKENNINIENTLFIPKRKLTEDEALYMLDLLYEMEAIMNKENKNET